MSKYYSQWGQDKYVNENFFHNKRDGVFVDVGAHDGIDLSNTYFFEKELGWTGLCIEPLPEIFERLEKNRTSTNIKGCANSENGDVIFCELSGYTEKLSTMKKNLSHQHSDRINSEILRMGGTKNEIRVQGFKLSDLFEKHSIKDIDYLSIDTEGSELDVLKGIDFDEVNISVIDVEENYADEGLIVKEFLESKGFYRFSKLYGDVIYLKNDFKFF